MDDDRLSDDHGRGAPSGRRQHGGAREAAARRAAYVATLAALVLLTRCSGGSDAGRSGLAATGAAALFDDLPLPALAFADPGPPAGAPARVVSLIASATELVCALGLEDRLVGRSTWCDFPPRVRRLPDLGGKGTFSKERIADLRPDLVILFSSEAELVRGLREEFGLRVLTPTTESVDAIRTGTLEIAGALGVPERGRALVAAVDAAIDAVRAEVAAKPPRRVLVALDQEPLYVAGRDSFVGRLVELAGGRNVAAGIEGAWPTVTPERVLDWDPEVVIHLAGGDIGDGRAAAEARRFWSRLDMLEAVRRGEVHVVPGGVVSRPGPRVGLVLERLARLVHGG